MSIYSSCTTLALNCRMYSNPERTQLAAAGWYAYGLSEYMYVDSNGYITSINNNCITIYNLYYSEFNCTEACNSGSPVTLRSFYNSITIGTVLYSDSNLLNTATGGFYSTGPGGTCYAISNLDGSVTGIVSCPSTCTAAGTYAYTSCEWNTMLSCTSDVVYRHDGSCGYYPDYYANYYCGCY